MKYRLIPPLTFIICGILFLVQSCSVEKKEEKKIVKKVVTKSLNPNGDSELAVLMREMFEEAKKIKKQVAKGEPITFNVEHEKILTAHATEPEKAASKEFKAFGKLYLETLKSLKNLAQKRL